MILEVVQDILNKDRQENQAHALIPGSMLAQVTKVSPLGAYEYKDMKIEGCEKCEPYTATITGKWYEYSLKILTRDGQIDASFPEIPGVKSKCQIPQGGKAAVIMLYGELRPHIVGEAL